MKKIILVLSIIFVSVIAISTLGAKEDKKMGNIYDFKVNKLLGEETTLGEYEGKVMLIVNTASECGFTPQYKGLQELYDKYEDKGLVVLGFPCNQFGSQEPGSSDQIKEFCDINYSVTFPMFEKIDVNGDNAHPLYKHLKSNASGFITDNIKWNFTKFLVDKEGNIVGRYGSNKKPSSLEAEIQKYL